MLTTCIFNIKASCTINGSVNFLEVFEVKRIPSFNFLLIRSSIIRFTTVDLEALAVRGFLGLVLLVVVDLLTRHNLVEVILLIAFCDRASLEPRVSFDLLHCVTITDILSQHSYHQFEELRGTLDLATLYVGSRVRLHALVVRVTSFAEGELSEDHDEEHDAHGKDINRRALVSLSVSHQFRGHVVGCPTLSHEI